jgi:preprotein translocase SecE subunit
VAKSKNTEKTTVTRITASRTSTVKKEKTPAKVAKTKVSAKSRKSEDKKPRPAVLRPFAAFLGYFAGAWYELRQVHWPNRRATWGLTGAVILFTGFFVILILLLDALFKYIFQLILG